MRDLNRLTLIGNVTRDPEIRTIPSGQSVASFAVATNRSWNDSAGQLQKAVEYTEIVAWGKLAEIAGQILKKGRRVYTEGRLQTHSWEGQDGVKRYKTEMIASELIVLDKPQGINLNGGEATAATVPSLEQVPTGETATTAEIPPIGQVPMGQAPAFAPASAPSSAEQAADTEMATTGISPEPVAAAMSATPVAPAEEIDIEDIPF